MVITPPEMIMKESRFSMDMIFVVTPFYENIYKKSLSKIFYETKLSVKININL